MNKLLLLTLTAILIFPTPSQSDTNHFGAGRAFELDLGDREIPWTHLSRKRTKAFRRTDAEKKATVIRSIIYF